MSIACYIYGRIRVPIQGRHAFSLDTLRASWAGGHGRYLLTEGEAQRNLARKPWDLHVLSGQESEISECYSVGVVHFLPDPVRALLASELSQQLIHRSQPPMVCMMIAVSISGKYLASLNSTIR